LRKNLLSRTQTWLELGEVKHRVDAARLRQLKLVSHCAHTREYAERPKVLEGQFLIYAALDQRLEIRLKL
jgi:hypothetical protein